MLTFAQIQQFKIDGYLLLPGVLSAPQCETLVKLTQHHLEQRIKPFELELDTRYPGAPSSDKEIGGNTIRRLLLADRRASEFADVAKRADIANAIQQILGSREVWLNPNHHNCVMTKQPEFSSETHWHRDTRYWSFDNKYLINAWYALGDEKLANGAMEILPGSHRWDVQNSALDDKQFLLVDHPDNQDRLATKRTIDLRRGDALLFSAHCFHAAGKNHTMQTKFSLVYTFHGEHTHALPKTRSSTVRNVKIET